MRKLKETQDHKGKTYRCCQDMCTAYNIKPNTYRNRIKKGMTVEQALTRPVGSVSIWENRKGYRY